MAADKYASLGQASARTRAMIERVRNPEPVLRALAPQLEGMIKASFDAQRSPAGNTWRKLRPSTLARRKPGEFTTPLKKTGATYAACKVYATRNQLRVRFPRVLLIHISGNAERRPPKRNPMPFEPGPDGRMRLIPKADRMLRDGFRNYVKTGALPGGMPLAAE